MLIRTRRFPARCVGRIGVPQAPNVSCPSYRSKFPLFDGGDRSWRWPWMVHSSNRWEAPVQIQVATSTTVTSYGWSQCSFPKSVGVSFCPEVTGKFLLWRNPAENCLPRKLSHATPLNRPSSRNSNLSSALQSDHGCLIKLGRERGSPEQPERDSGTATEQGEK